jgi:hypothetical protein
LYNQIKLNNFKSPINVKKNYVELVNDFHVHFISFKSFFVNYNYLGLDKNFKSSNTCNFYHWKYKENTKIWKKKKKSDFVHISSNGILVYFVKF